MSFIFASLSLLSPIRLPGLAINDKNLQSFIKWCRIHAELRKMVRWVLQLQSGPDNTVFSSQWKFHYLGATALELGNSLFLLQTHAVCEKFDSITVNDLQQYAFSWEQSRC